MACPVTITPTFKMFNMLESWMLFNKRSGHIKGIRFNDIKTFRVTAFALGRAEENELAVLVLVKFRVDDSHN